MDPDFWSDFTGIISDPDTFCQDLTVEELGKAL